MTSRFFLLSLFSLLALACSSEGDAKSARDSGSERVDSGAGDAQMPSTDGSVKQDAGMMREDSGMSPNDAGMMPTDASTQTLCEATGGTVETSLCCIGAGDFPNTCTIGGCGCGPSASEEIKRCTCPAGGCYKPGVGCSVKVCTPGSDQTCNDNPAISSLHGKCLANGSCQCNTGFTRSATSGKCL